MPNLQGFARPFSLAANPCPHLRLPAVRGRRERIASPEEVQRLLAALSERDPVWATALYSGLRGGELPPLCWEDVDLAAGVIRVDPAVEKLAKVDGVTASAWIRCAVDETLRGRA